MDTKRLPYVFLLLATGVASCGDSESGAGDTAGSNAGAAGGTGGSAGAGVAGGGGTAGTVAGSGAGGAGAGGMGASGSGAGGAGAGGAGAGSGGAGGAGSGGAGAGGAGSAGKGGSGGTPGVAIDVAFATFNATLDGAFAPSPSARRQPIADALGKAPADVLCVVQAMTESDKVLLSNGAKAAFPYSKWVETDLETPIDDPTDATGNIPAPYADAACAAPKLQPLLEDLLTCMKDKCSTKPGSDDGTSVESACLADQCTGPAATLLFGDFASKRCFSCALYPLFSFATFASVRSGCTKDPHAGLAFGGTSGALILSKYPLGQPTKWVYPSTGWRTVGLHAPVSLPNGAVVDVHCQVLVGPKNATTQPYVGLYGKGETGDQGWTNETILQAQKVVARVKSASPTGRAVLLGDFYTGPAVASVSPQIAPQAPEAFAVLESGFVRALAPGYVPQCTLCAENPLVNGAPGTGTWTSHVFLHGIDVAAVKENGVFFKEPVIVIGAGGSGGAGGAGGGTTVPLSNRYGFRAVVTIPAP